MITVEVRINRIPIFVRSARNIGYAKGSSSVCKYKIDSGQVLYHERDQGFVPLVKQMLDCIDEDDITWVSSGEDAKH